ncbi:MAG: outer membrane protein assembly factor BamE [Ignavibacteria bacterium]|nr:outer membrane protein assembly factor BamE [Ignavibacteria bacterium]
MTLIRLFLAAIVVVTVATGCRTVQDNQRDLSSTRERELTAGVVRKEIKKGMSGAQVAELLGSPNITTLDENNRETWVYDKIATEASYSESQSGMFLILGGFSNRSGAASTTQRTLTVVIKFSADSKVESFTYHQSKF